MVSVLEGCSTFDRVFVSKGECVDVTSNFTRFSILLIETICKIETRYPPPDFVENS